MYRELIAHKVNGLNEALDIIVTDEPGAGGANHEYLILGPVFKKSLTQEDVDQLAGLDETNPNYDRFNKY